MFTICLLLVIAINARLAPLNLGKSTADVIQNHYIVVFKADTPHDVFAKQIENSKSMLSTENVHHVYKTALKGFSGKISPDQLLQLRQNPFVDYIELDRVVKAVDCGLQASGSWGQTRISQTGPVNLDDTFYASSKQGAGVTSYIVDTGIYVENQDFEGRAIFGYKAEKTWSNTDGNGHGTHVASTVGGKLYGIAKKISLIAVKVLGDDGSGSWSGVISGIEYVINDYQTKGKKPSTANLSLGGGYSSAINQAVESAIAAGIVFVVAAGNDNADACNYSPASAPSAVTVGSTDVGDNDQGQEIDVRSYFSNYGECVDIFAPGSLIKAAWIGGPTKVNTISGTSMASPHVCGVASLLLGDENGLTPTDVKHQLNQFSQKNLIDLTCSDSACNLSPNRLLNNGC